MMEMTMLRCPVSSLPRLSRTRHPFSGKLEVKPWLRKHRLVSCFLTRAVAE